MNIDGDLVLWIAVGGASPDDSGFIKDRSGRVLPFQDTGISGYRKTTA